MKKYFAVSLFFLIAYLAYSQGFNTTEQGSVHSKNKVGSDDFTPANSGLVSAKVNKIFIDSFNVKWFGTDKGISRFDGKNWTVIDASNHLRNNTINDIQYEKTSSGNEIWVATNGGMSVMSFDIDGVTAATTYYVGGPESGIISDTVTAVGIDKNHVRWIATPKGINTFGSKGWDTTYIFFNPNMEAQNWNGLIVNSIGSYEKSGSVYMGTSGQGVIRYSYDDVDGFTGATAMSHSGWSHLWSDTVLSVSIYDTIQWYGTPLGAFEHFGPATKNNWDFELTTWEGIINPVVKDIEKDDAGNIWIGTENGLHIITKNGILNYGPAMQTSHIEVFPTDSLATISWTNGNGLDGIMLNDNVNDIQKDFNGNIWIASNSGVEFYNYLPGIIAKRVVFVTEINSSSIAPVDGVTYTSNSKFKKGTAISNWFCVYNGPENTVDISGLNSNTTYKVIAFEYYGEPGNEKYYLGEGINNPIIFTTNSNGVENLSYNIAKVYPIPIKDYVIVHLKNFDKNYNASIYNLNGRKFKDEQLRGNNQKINTSDLDKGVYLLKISDGKNEEILKICK